MIDDSNAEDLNALVRQLNQMARGEAPHADESGEEADGAAGASVGLPPLPRAAPAAAGERRDWRVGPVTEEGRERAHALLTMARAAGATDLFLIAGAPPAIRRHGDLEALPTAVLDAQEVERLVSALVPAPRRGELAQRGAIDLSWGTSATGRFRCNVHRESGGWAVAVRLFPLTIPTLAELNLPAELASLAELRHGIVLVTGPAGSGKSTTLAALLALVTGKRRAHVITIEDPIEYRHGAGAALVEQIEVGRDTPSFADALRAALRQNPDVILVGEMRDPETIALAVTAAETGHLVFSTLHTGDAVQSVSRILDAYPPGQQAFVRSQLAVALAAVVSQQLIPRRDGSGRVPAVEILIGTDAVRNLILKGQTEQIAGQIGISRQRGMRTFEASLAELVKAGHIERAEARARARRPQELEALLGP